MPAFRSMPDLPSVLNCGDWNWSPYEAGKSKPFWLGTDVEGTRWLTKMRGGFNAYREIVFARLAQGSAITREVCMFVGSLADSDIEELLLVPSGVHIAMSWSIGDRLRSARDFAFEFVRKNTGERRA